MVHVLRSVISIAENEPTLLAIRRAGSPEEIRDLISAHILASVEQLKQASGRANAH
jgi:hypothetical protein